MSEVPEPVALAVDAAFRRATAAVRLMSWSWATLHSTERGIANGDDEPGEATARHDWLLARDAAAAAMQALVAHVEAAQLDPHRLEALVSELRMMHDAGPLLAMRDWLARYNAEAGRMHRAFALARRGVAVPGVGTGTERPEETDDGDHVDRESETAPPEFTRIERAIALLMRDRNSRKSMRELFRPL